MPTNTIPATPPTHPEVQPDVQLEVQALPIFCCGNTRPVITSWGKKLHNDPNHRVHNAIYNSFLCYARRRGEAAERAAKRISMSTDTNNAAITNLNTTALVTLLGGNDEHSTPPASPATGEEHFYQKPQITPPVISAPSDSSISSCQSWSSQSQFIVPEFPAPPPPPRLERQSLIPQPQIIVPAPAPLLTVESLMNNPIAPDAPYIMHLTSRHDFGPVFSHRYFICPPELQHDWIEVSLIHWFVVSERYKLKAEQWDLKCDDDAKFYRYERLIRDF